MRSASVICPACSATVEVEASALAFPCPRCHQTLVLESDHDQLKREAMEQLDQEWRQEQNQYLHYERGAGFTGGYRVVNKVQVLGSAAAAILGGVAILIWIPRQPGLEWMMWFIALLMIIMGIAGAAVGMAKVKKYQQAKASYEARRRAIEEQFNGQS